MNRPAIAVESLVYRWPGAERPLFKIPRFTVQRGTSVVLMGPSGSGKSTLLELLVGIRQPTAGRISVAGVEVSSLSPRLRDRFRASEIGFMFQDFGLIGSLSALTNVRLGAAFSGKRVAKDAARNALENVGLEPNCYDRPASRLSHGQAQRVALARALINDPSLLVADEPTSSLDVSAREAALIAMIAGTNHSGRTLICVSHDPAIAHHFDIAMSMEDLCAAI